MTVLSIIIPTRNRAGMLADCLRTLMVQQVDPEAVEVLVVDDGSTDGTADVAAAFSGERIGVRCARQEPSGLNAGRNNGARFARGSILAYLDDDTLVAPGWAQAMVDAFALTGCDAVAGRIHLRLEGVRPAWLTPRMEMFLSALDLGADPAEMHDLPFGFGANLAVAREALERIGGFGAGLDREGSSLLSNGDKEFFVRLHAARGKIVYWPRASVHHRVPAERLQRGWFRRRFWWQGVSDGLIAGGDASAVRTTATEVARASRSVPILAAGLLRRRGPFGAELWLRYCAGRIAGARRARRAAGTHAAPAADGARRRA